MSDLAKIIRAAPRGMITFRGDLSAAKVKKAVKAVTGHAIPEAGQIAGDGALGVAWMSPDELLLMVPYHEVAATREKIDKALKGLHYQAEDVSDARAVFTVEGDNAAEVLARLCPVDFQAAAFPQGQFRRTRMAQVAAAMWRHETGFDVVCFRSVGDYAETLLKTISESAAPAGYL